MTTFLNNKDGHPAVRYPREGSQRRIILDRLIAATGSPVGVNILRRVTRSCCVHSQVAALRSMGGDVRNKQRVIKEGGQSVTHSEYWLIEESDAAK